MRKILLLFAVMLMAFTASAQLKVAILEPVDKAQNVSYGVKLLLRSSLTSAISNTPGYEGYDRVDMASIAGEQEFQRTGNVSDNQIRQIGRAAGAAYVLVAEAAKYDATSIIITAKLLDVETFGVKSSAVLVSGISADEMQVCCNTLASKLLKTSGENREVPQTKQIAQEKTEPKPQKSLVSGEVGTVVVFPDNSRGVVFYKDNNIGLAVSLDYAELEWHTANRRKDYRDIAQIPNNEDDGLIFAAGSGAQFTKSIISELTYGTAPAAEWCVRHGSGWYLPRAGELVYLFKTANSKGQIDNALKQAGGVPLERGWYWSSSECNAKEAININHKGGASDEEKNTKVKVRAIRAF